MRDPPAPLPAPDSSPAAGNPAPGTMDPRCPNCRAAAVGTYCHACGQDQRLGRLTFRRILASALERVLNLEQPLARTIVHLTIRPGATAAAYVRGRRVRFSNPFTYCLLWAALTTITVQVLSVELLPANVTERLQGLSADGPIPQERLHGVVVEWLGLINVALLPILAALLRLFFWEWRVNLAEWYAAMLFTYGHVILLSWPPLVLGLRNSTIGMLVLTAFPLVFVPYAVCGFIDRRGPSVILRAAAATGVYFLTFPILGAVVGAVMTIVERRG